MKVSYFIYTTVLAVATFAPVHAKECDVSLVSGLLTKFKDDSDALACASSSGFSIASNTKGVDAKKLCSNVHCQGLLTKLVSMNIPSCTISALNNVNLRGMVDDVLKQCKNVLAAAPATKEAPVPAPKPVAPAPKPVAPAPKPVAPASKPVAPASKPVAPASKPVAPASKPVAPAPKPVVPAAYPAATPAATPAAAPAATPAANSTGSAPVKDKECELSVVSGLLTKFTNDSDALACAASSGINVLSFKSSNIDVTKMCGNVNCQGFLAKLVSMNIPSCTISALNNVNLRSMVDDVSKQCKNVTAVSPTTKEAPVPAPPAPKPVVPVPKPVVPVPKPVVPAPKPVVPAPKPIVPTAAPASAQPVPSTPASDSGVPLTPNATPVLSPASVSDAPSSPVPVPVPAESSMDPASDLPTAHNLCS